MSVIIQKSVTPLRHEKCGYSWEYGGRNPYYATCPYCRNHVNIKKNAIVQTYPQVGAPEQFAQSSTKTGGIESRNG